MWNLFVCGLAFVYASKLSRHVSIPKLTDYESFILHKMSRNLEEQTSYLSYPRSICLSFEYSFIAHHGQYRPSGDHLVMNPYELCLILCTHKMDAYSIITALLHDILKERDANYDINKLFGPNISDIVQGVKKISTLPPKIYETLNTENMRSFIISMSTDWRILVIILAKRLHNMRTLNYLPVCKQRKIAKETSDIFVPIAHRFGLYKLKCELGDLCFRYLDNEQYVIISEFTNKFVWNKKFFWEFVVSKVQENLCKHNIKCDITYRTKSYHSIAEKMKKTGLKLHDIRDILAMRIVLDTDVEQCCYYVMDILSSIWDVQDGSYKDYIMFRKSNGYQSLHAVYNIVNTFVEVQVRTKCMHKIAEYGTASHWMYKDDTCSAYRQLYIRHMNESSDLTVFVDNIRSKLLNKHIFVFMNDQVLSIDKDSSVENIITKPDFDYSIEINNEMKPGSTVLKNGDVIYLKPFFNA